MCVWGGVGNLTINSDANWRLDCGGGVKGGGSKKGEASRNRGLGEELCWMILWNLQEGNHQQSEGVLVGGAGLWVGWEVKP